LSLDVSADGRVLYIHAMYIQDVDQFKDSIKKELEKRLLEVLR
jgi:multicomponent Na+:H+ antiporter subunit E